VKSATFGFGLLALGAILGHPLSVYAQTPSTQWKDLVGTWEEDMSQRASTVVHYVPGSLIATDMVFRPDSTLLWSNIHLDGPDTLATTGKGRAVLAGDTLEVTNSTIGPSGWWGSRTLVIALRDQELTMHYWCGGPEEKPWECQTRTYKRIKPAQRRFERIIATGFALRGPVPAHPATPTGTLTDLLSAWEGIPTAEWQGRGVARSIRVFLPDSTYLNATIYKDGQDQMVYGTARGLKTWAAVQSKERARWEWGWEDWKRTPGDSIIIRPHWEGKLVLNNQQLSFYYKDKLVEAFKASTLSQQP